MKQRMRSTAATVILLFLLAGCGRFAIEGQVLMEATPTAASAAMTGEDNIQALAETADAPANLPTAQTTRPPRLPSVGLAEILILTGVSIVASFALGAYLTSTGRPAVFDERPMQDERPEPTTLLNLLRFSPNVRAVALSLCTWVFMLGVIAVVLIGGGLLLLSGNTGGRDQEITLTVPTSILLENNGNYVGIPLADLACSLRTGTDREHLLCDMTFEEQMLKLDVVLTAGTFWECTATYGDQIIPCRASFSDEDLQTFIVMNSTLGLSEARLQQLAAAQLSLGLTMIRWLGLDRLIAGPLALAAFVVLWRHSRSRTIVPSRATAAIAAVYSVSISLMLYGLAYYVANLSLLLLGVID